MSWIGIIGLIAGCLIGIFSRCALLLYASHLYTSHVEGPRHDLGLLDELDKGSYNSHTSDDNLVLIGVMTAKKFLSSKAVAVHRTWMKSIPGKVIFFSSEGSEIETPPGLSVIALKKAGYVYPPQKKAFMMLKFMHDHFLHKFRYFMRADDDLYIRGDRLGQLLHSINGSQTVFLGQTGMGKRKDTGKLKLNSSENFCMGGPGIVFSRKTLSVVISNLGACLKNLHTTEEDVEIGRCVSKFAGVSCTWAYEMVDIFHHNYKDPNGSYTRPLKDEAIDNAVTLHPVKNASYQYRMHQYFLSLKVSEFRKRLSLLQHEVNAVNSRLKDRGEFYLPRENDETLSWDFFSKSVFTTKSLNPKHAFEVDRKTSLDNKVAQVLKLMNQNSRTKGRTYGFRNLLHGYSRVKPLFGVDSRLNLQLFYKSSSRTTATPAPVKQSIYAQQPFLEVEFEEDDTVVEKTEAGKRGSLSSQLKLGVENEAAFYGLNVRVNFIVPLSGRHKTFLRFMHSFEDACLKRRENASLVIVLYSSEGENKSEEIVTYIQKLQKKYPDFELRVVCRDGPFSRGEALQHGSSLFAESDLLFFVDVDIQVHQNALQRIRLNTVAGKSAYFPIVFSQYDPRLVCKKGKSSGCSSGIGPVAFDSEIGYWRHFGYGIVALINSDFRRIGGFDLNIKGWGKEDVDLFDKFISCNMSIFRSVDTGLLHNFHPIVCDPNLDPAQHKMCIGSKVTSYASTYQLGNYVFQTSEIFNRNELPERAIPEADNFRGSNNSRKGDITWKIFD